MAATPSGRAESSLFFNSSCQTTWCSIPADLTSASRSATAHAGGGYSDDAGGTAILTVAEQVLKLEGRDPAVQALDDLHRTKVRPLC